MEERKTPKNSPYTKLQLLNALLIELQNERDVNAYYLKESNLLCSGTCVPIYVSGISKFLNELSLLSIEFLSQDEGLITAKFLAMKNLFFNPFKIISEDGDIIYEMELTILGKLMSENIPLDKQNSQYLKIMTSFIENILNSFSIQRPITPVYESLLL